MRKKPSEKAQPTTEKKKPSVVPNIRDFLKEMRRKNEVKEATEKRVEDPMPSTQEIIEDARERRIMNKKGKTHL